MQWWLVEKDGAQYICTMPERNPDLGAMTSYSLVLEPPFTVLRLANLQEAEWAEQEVELCSKEIEDSD